MSDKVAIIGCGAVSEMFHIPAALELLGSEDVVFVDNNTSRLEATAHKFGILSTASYLLNVKSSLDAVVIAASPHTHQSIAEDNLVDIILIAGYHPRAVGESFLLTDGEKITWREFFGHYAKMVNADIKDIPSIKSIIQRKDKPVSFVKLKIRSCVGFLTNIINRSENQQSALIKYGLKAPRKLLNLNMKLLNYMHHEPYDKWDLMKFSSPGFISIKKANKFLNYTPRKTVEEGMSDCAIRLKEQNIIQK